MTGASTAWATAPASAALIAYFLWRGRLAGRLFVDALAVGVTLGAAVAMALAPFELKTNPLHFSATTLAFLFAGLPEEGVKMLGVAAFLAPHWLARGRRDVVYAAGALSLGFAALENVFYLANAGAGWATLAVERALTATLFHVFVGLAGGLVVASVQPGLRGLALALAGWAGVAVIHGLYDFAVFAGATGTAAPPALGRLVAALGWDLTTTLRALLAAAEAAAALAAVAAVATLSPAAPDPAAGRFVRLARSRALGLVVGLPLAGAALLAIGAGALAGVVSESAVSLFGVALYAILPLGLGALFLIAQEGKRALSRRGRRALAGAGLAVALALGAAAIVWGPAEWRSLVALRYEARGQKFAARGDYADAIEAYTQALAVSPEPIVPLSQRAAVYVAAGQFAPALADLDAALRLAPANIALYVQRGDADRQNNDYAAAAADLDAALKVKPGDPQLLALRGQARLEAGDAVGAHDDLVTASRVAPDNALVRRIFADWDVDAGDFDAALRDLSARLHADPADALAAFQRGRVWLYKGEAKRARDDFVRADDKPGFLYPALWRFLAEIRLRGDAGAALRQRLAAAPDKWPAPVARLYLGEIDFAAARARAGSGGDRCEADFYFAMLRLLQDTADETAARLRAALAECPAGFIEHEGAEAELRRLRADDAARCVLQQIRATWTAPVIPAKARIQGERTSDTSGIPAFAGMTRRRHRKCKILQSGRQPMRFDPETRRLKLDPRNPAFFADPYAAYAELHASPGPVFWEDYGFWCVAQHSLVGPILRDRRFGRQILHVLTREELGWPDRPAHLAGFDALERHSLLELEPPEHTRLRALVNRAFVSRQAERLAPEIAALAERLIDGFTRDGEADLLSAFAAPIPVGIIAVLIGAPVEDSALLLDWSHKMVAMYQFAPTRAAEHEADAAARDFADYVRRLAAERRRSPHDDLISQLNAAESLSEDELVATVALLLNAGHEATVHALGNSVATILQHGAAFNDGSETAVDELLRFEPPLHLFTRYVLEDAEFKGVLLRRGERVGLLLGAANRDPEVFAEPNRLDLGRRRNPHLAFGAGIHFCVGAPLARLEMRVTLPILFARLPGLKLAEPPRWRDSFHFHGLEALRARWTTA